MTYTDPEIQFNYALEIEAEPKPEPSPWDEFIKAAYVSVDASIDQLETVKKCTCGIAGSIPAIDHPPHCAAHKPLDK